MQTTSVLRKSGNAWMLYNMKWIIITVEDGTKNRVNADKIISYAALCPEYLAARKKREARTQVIFEHDLSFEVLETVEQLDGVLFHDN